MSTETIGLGYLIAGISIGVIGAIVIRAVASDLYGWWCARKVDRIFAESVEQQESAAAPFAHTLDDGHEDYDLALAKHTADGLARLEMAVDVALLANPRSVLWAFPEQRQPYDRETEGL